MRDEIPMPDLGQKTTMAGTVKKMSAALAMFNAMTAQGLQHVNPNIKVYRNSATSTYGIDVKTEYVKIINKTSDLNSVRRNIIKRQGDALKWPKVLGEVVSDS